MKIELTRAIITAIPICYQTIVSGKKFRGKYGPVKEEIVEAINSDDIKSLITWSNMKPWIAVECFIAVATFGVFKSNLYFQYVKWLKGEPSGVKTINELIEKHIKYNLLSSYIKTRGDELITQNDYDKYKDCIRVVFVLINRKFKHFPYSPNEILEYVKDFDSDCPRYRCIWKIWLCLIYNELGTMDSRRSIKIIKDDKCEFNCQSCDRLAGYTIDI